METNHVHHQDIHITELFCSASKSRLCRITQRLMTVGQTRSILNSSSCILLSTLVIDYPTIVTCL